MPALVISPLPFNVICPIVLVILLLVSNFTLPSAFFITNP